MWPPRCQDARCGATSDRGQQHHHTTTTLSTPQQQHRSTGGEEADGGGALNIDEASLHLGQAAQCGGGRMSGQSDGWW